MGVKKIDMNILRPFFLVLVLALSACGKEEKPDLLATSNSPTPVLVFGDSLSAGYNIREGKEWPVLFEQKLKTLYWIRPDQSVANYSKSGETSSGGLRRFQEALDETKPLVVILELGANDALRRTSMTALRANLTEMIVMCQKRNIEVVLVGVDLPARMFFVSTGSFIEIYQDLDKEKGVVFVDNLLKNVNNKSSLMQSDMLHPNEHGQLLMLENIWPGFEEAVREKSN